MKFSQIWCRIVALLFVFSVTVSFLAAQTEESSTVNAPSSAEVQSDSAEAQLSSDEPEQKQSTLAPNRDTASSSNTETDQRTAVSRREFLNYQEKLTNWWLDATAIFLTLLGVSAAILGYFGFKRLDRIESEAREYMEASEQHAEEAQRYVEDIKTMRDKIKMDLAVSEAISLQEQNRTDEASEKWRSIAAITEKTDDERAAEAWFFVGYCKGKGKDLTGALVAFSKAIDLNLSGPNLPYAYFNLGNIKTRLGQTEDALDDYDAAINLNSFNADFYIERSATKQKLRDPDGAIADLDKAIGLNAPDAASIYLKQASIMIFSSRRNEARPYCEKALDLARKKSDADLEARVKSLLESLDSAVA